MSSSAFRLANMLVSLRIKKIVCVLLGFAVVGCSTVPLVNYSKTGTMPTKRAKVCSSYLFDSFSLDGMDLDVANIAKAQGITEITSVSTQGSKNVLYLVTSYCVTVKGN